MALIDLLYQFWVHTEQVGKLGWFDRVFCSPSNHRVHHAVNDEYLDKNYGGVLVLWDRLFGSFRQEGTPCIYGTRGALNSWDPLWANAEVYWALLKDSWHAGNAVDKLRVWLMPPGWRPADVARRFPKPAFDLKQVSTFDPPASRTVQTFAAVQFLLLLAGVLTVLWFAATWSALSTAVWSAALGASFWALGAVLQGRISPLEVLLIEAAALSTAGSTLGVQPLYFLFKPLTMLIAIVYAAFRASRTGGITRFDALLMAALTASLVGDVLLMLPGNYFIAGLAAFLVGHLFYITLFRQGQVWFPSRLAVVGTLSFGAAMVAWLWAGLNGPVLKMAVALGAGVFMLSDSLIAINRFVQPLPLASLWVLSSYYLAQILIAHNARPAPPAR
ncbi:lysoplasmalogenase family protein [Rhodoferax sp.]|uniref:lysoplasmalogenase family protein n=1 Tax=Rhodoferax sp. TaxID=50421 RepID=UPI0039B966B2